MITLFLSGMITGALLMWGGHELYREGFRSGFRAGKADE